MNHGEARGGGRRSSQVQSAWDVVFLFRSDTIHFRDGEALVRAVLPNRAMEACHAQLSGHSQSIAAHHPGASRFNRVLRNHDRYVTLRKIGFRNSSLLS